MAIASALRQLAKELGLYADGMDVRGQSYVETLEDTFHEYGNAFLAKMDNMQGPPGTPLSVPPSGFFKVTNLYVNEHGKLIVLYDDVPTP